MELFNKLTKLLINGDKEFILMYLHDSALRIFISKTTHSLSLIKSRVSKIIIYKLDRKREKFIEKFPSLFPNRFHFVSFFLSLPALRRKR